MYDHWQEAMVYRFKRVAIFLLFVLVLLGFFKSQLWGSHTLALYGLTEKGFYP